MLSSDQTDESREKNYVYILALKDKMAKTLLEHAKREEKDKRFLVAATVPKRGIDPFTSYLGDMNVRAKDLQVLNLTSKLKYLSTLFFIYCSKIHDLK